MKANMVVWFEIAVRDMDRAKKFYENVFNVEISLHDLGGVVMGFFPSNGEAPGAMGSLILEKSYVPSHQGTLVYFASDDVQKELNKVLDAGGKILQEKTMISPEHGFMGVFEDSEGNRIALHSQK